MEAAPKKKKALPFKRTAPKPAPREESSDRDDDADLDMFRRSKNFFPIAMEEQEERFTIKTSPKEDRKPSLDFTYEGTGRSPGEESAKRRKLSPAAVQDEWDELYDNSEDEAPRDGLVKAEQSQSPTTARIKAGSPVRNNNSLTPRPSRIKDETKSSPFVSGALPTPIKSSTTPDGVISLDDDSDDSVPITRSRSAQKPRDTRPVSTTMALLDDDDDLVVVGNDEEEDEDEFAIFIQRARAREAAMKAAAEKRAKSPDLLSSNDLTDSPATDADVHDPVVQIFITSCLSAYPDIKPLLIQRRLSQNMRLVRDSWLANIQSKFHLDLSPAEEAKIILTWKRAKIYNMTTGLSLGLQPDEKGRVGVFAGRDDGFDKGRLHLEVWHEDELGEYVAEEERRRRAELGDEIEDGIQYEDDELDTEEVPQQQKIRVTLKGKEMDEIKLTTYADTPARTLVAAVRARNRWGSDKHITVMFDGDPLEENTTMGAAAIEDLDVLEVYVK